MSSRSPKYRFGSGSIGLSQHPDHFETTHGPGKRDGVCTGRCCKATFLLIISVLALIVGLGLIFGLPKFVDYEVKQTLEVYNGSTSYDTFVEPTEPVYMSYFVFNVTNPEEVLQGGKPNVQEFGPFEYLEVRKRVNISFMDNGTVKWVQPKSYIFQPNQSIAKDDEFEICTINFPVMFLGSLMEPILQKLNTSNLPKFVKDLFLEVPKILEALAGEDVILCKTVHEIIWGVHDPVFERIRESCLDEGQRLKHFAKDIVPGFFRALVLDVAEQLLSVGKLIPEGGNVSVQTNGTDDGTWATFTGTEDMQLINTLDLYDNSKTVPWWNNKYCNMVNGTDGTQFHPNIKKTDILFSFVTELCRSLDLVYNGTVELKGLSLYRYTPPPMMFDNGTNFEFLSGFCVPHCWPSGTQDVSACQNGLPIMMSSPHFLYADPVYLQNVTGMHPNFNDHATLIDLEPTTGLMLRGNKRLQVNFRVTNFNFLPHSSALRDCFLPLFYADESAIVSDSDAAKLRGVLKPINALKISQWCLVPFGAVVLVATLVYNVRRYRRENEPIDIPEEKTENDPLIQ